MNIFEVLDFYNLSPDEQKHLYDLYKNSYDKSVGSAWTLQKFFDRAEDWIFFGDKNGYVAARPQESGMYKLAVIGGNPRGILKGIQELSSLNKPIWGMVSKDILPMMKKLGFKTPNILVMKTLLKIIPKNVFGQTDYKVNSDGSITLNYEDTGSATKYFVGNQQYFDFLKTQIKDKMNPLKLTNILKEIIKEAKQVGNLYHYTPIENIKNIVISQYLKPNEENQISTSVRANMDASEFSKMKDKSIARIMLDGDKISNKYKIRPFSNNLDTNDYEDLGEEAIVTNGKNFPIMPYLKRIDFFLDKKTKKTITQIETISKLLTKVNIPYKIYDGTPLDNIPYTQPKDGSPDNINLDKLPKFEEYTEEELYFPNMKVKMVKRGSREYDFDGSFDLMIYPLQVAISPEYPEYYITLDFKENLKDEDDFVNVKGENINYKVIPIPMYDDPKWREKWKYVSSLAKDGKNKFGRDTYDSYVLLPKKEVDV
jgi:hypothetical protein